MDEGEFGFEKDLLLPKISDTYPIMRKLGTVIPYLHKTQEI